MKFLNRKKLTAIVLLAGLVTVLVFATSSDRKVDYSLDVKPILNKKCITCHGGVKAKGGFSVLFREDALAKTESGKYAIVPGKPDKSEMIRRINEKDPEERMPYKHEPLSDEEISILTRWIKQGAKWGDHWAYLPVKPVAVPDIKSDWMMNDVDRFIYQKLKEMEMEPSAMADKATLLRRVSLDLIGMYPSDAVAKKYLASNDPNAYETLVDSLLASPHFGERWATMWLDVARYADSKGYEADVGRRIWKYRDWVIKAFNQDMPYDQFLRDQIAGDLLPDPTDAQYIATAFNRNSMTNDEGGTDNEEFRTSAVLDRVNTTWEGLMGTTFACVQCHSHPYDPFRHDEFYSFVAYFNNTRDEDQNPEYPFLRDFNDTLAKDVEKLSTWVKERSTKEDADAVKLFVKMMQPAVYGSNADSIVNGFIDGNNGPLGINNNSSFRLKNIKLKDAEEIIMNSSISKIGGLLSVHVDAPDGKIIGQMKLTPNKWEKLVSFPVNTDKNDNRLHDVYFTYQNKSLPSNHSDNRLYIAWMAFNKSLPGKNDPAYPVYSKMYRDLLNAKVDNTPVMIENPSYMHRTTHVFERGNRLTLGKEVTPRVPKSLSFAMPAGSPPDRRGLVMWLTDHRNPLVSRTIVNRLWEQLFGTGIVETLEDMGTQGIPPTHRELLDHYAYKLMTDYGWSIKKLLKELVMSATYRQDSRFNEAYKDKDASNRYYSHAPRVRLSAEQLRDQHLCISGVMSEKMFGPPVMPWQPAGIWSNPYNSESWNKSEGEDQYRRGVYTYIKRTGTYPSMISFDATSRIVCTARRIRTNTPLQALVTLNDSVYLDMAAHFAERMQREGGANVRSQIAKGYEAMLYKKIPEQQLQILERLYQQALNTFNADDSSAVQLVGDQKLSNSNKTEGVKEIRQLAALKVVANAMMNLDEVITKN